MSNIPEGWYPNPSDPNSEIFWNGSGWSGAQRPTTATTHFTAPNGAAPQPGPTLLSPASSDPGQSQAVEPPQTKSRRERRPWPLLAKAMLLPLWARIAIPAAVIVLITVMVVVIAQPRGSAAAEAACRAAAIDGMRAPSKANIVEIETRAAPQEGKQKTKWATFILKPALNGTIEQLDGLSDVTGPFTSNNGEDDVKAIYKPNTYFAVGKIDGTNAYGAIVRESFLCGVLVDGTAVKKEAQVAYFG